MKADFEHRKKRSTAHRKRSEQFEKTAKTKQQEVETLTQTVADLQASSVVLEQQVKKATEVIGNLAGEKESLQAEVRLTQDEHVSTEADLEVANLQLTALTLPVTYLHKRGHRALVDKTAHMLWKPWPKGWTVFCRRLALFCRGK